MARSLLVFVALAGSATSAAGQEVRWVRQFGTTDPDNGWGVAAGEGAVYVAGSTQGAFGGPGAGGQDAFLSRYDPAGNQTWVRQIGTAGTDRGYCVAVDSAGHVYMAGSTGGGLSGPSAGGDDAFLARYDAAGNLVWLRQLGTSASEAGRGVALHGAGTVYLCGTTSGNLGGPNAGSQDVFLAKYDAAGNLVWARQFGVAGADFGNGVAVDSAWNVYVSGAMTGFGGHSDALLAKYDAEGNVVWMRQFGTAGRDEARGVAVDREGDAYVVGTTAGILGGPSAGGNDAFLAKYDPAGDQIWVRQIGTAGTEEGWGIAAASTGEIYITGLAGGALGGSYAGLRDMFLARYDAAGIQAWVRQVGTAGDDYSLGVAAGGAGEAYIAGWTAASFGEPGVGPDAILIKYGPPCYANCDSSTAAPVLNVSDFICFLNRFAGGDSYANCDGSTVPPVLNVADFICFTNAFAAGCP